MRGIDRDIRASKIVCARTAVGVHAWANSTPAKCFYRFEFSVDDWAATEPSTKTEGGDEFEREGYFVDKCMEDKLWKRQCYRRDIWVDARCWGKDFSVDSPGFISNFLSANLITSNAFIQ